MRARQEAGSRRKEVALAIHEVEPTRANLHGHFSPGLPPILTIDSGDTVVYRTIDAGWSLYDQEDPYLEPKKLEPRQAPQDARIGAP